MTTMCTLCVTAGRVPRGIDREAEDSGAAADTGRSSLAAPAIFLAGNRIDTDASAPICSRLVPSALFAGGPKRHRGFEAAHSIRLQYGDSRDGIDLEFETAVPDSITKTRSCPKCGSARTSLVGASQTPPLTLLKCEACGYFYSVSTRPPSRIANPDRNR
jgi:rubredoxin